MMTAMSGPDAIDACVTLIVACARGGVIGRDNALPWRLPEDLRHFKATTLGHVLIMGRRTFESIGRPLPGRVTIVVTRNAAWRADGCLTANSLEAALELAHAENRGEIFIAGGADVYRQAMPFAARLLVTAIEIDVQGDAHFPPIEASQWRVQSTLDQQGANGLRYAIVDYRRRD